MLIILVVFTQSFLFSIFQLNIRKLEERGVSARAIAGLQRYSIFPAVALFLLAFRPEYLSILLAHPVSLWWIAGIAFFWSIGQFLTYVVLDSANSLSFIYTINAFLTVPVYLAAGILINYDFPNLYVLIALGLLIVAFIIKPTQNKENKRRLLKYGVIVTIGLVLANVVSHALGGAFYKNVLHLLRPETVLFGISAYILVTSLAINIMYLLPIFKKPSAEEKVLIKKHFWIAYLIPALWFVASLPEGYSFANLPLFTMSALGAFSFLIRMASDLKNKRLAWNLRTASFALVVILSIVFSTLSLK